MEATEWHEFLAVETVNAAANTITLAPGAAHVMHAHISVEDIKR
jgi:glucose-6-phosphate 1-epimerase